MTWWLQDRQLKDLVTTLAKNYAQRLVTAARRSCQGVDPSTPLSPQHVLTAHYSRVQAGLDPGFFLQTQRNVTTVAESSAAVAAALGTNDANALQRSATLAAQEEYDKYMKEKNESKSDEMDVDEIEEKRAERKEQANEQKSRLMGTGKVSIGRVGREDRD